MTRRQLYTLLATIIGSGIVFLDGSVVNLALPHIATDLHASFAGLQWIIDGYLLSLSALILLGGSLGDIVGQKKVYLTGLVGFGVASILCGIAPNVSALIAIRILQGIFGALVVPSALAIINTNFEPEKRAHAIGRWTALSSVVIAIGPLVGGTIIDKASWRWIFFINVPLLVITILFALAGIIEHQNEKVRKIDLTGGLLAMLGLGGLTYGLIEGPVQNWRAQSLIPLIAGVIIFAYFIWFERRQSDPMLKLDLFKSGNFTAANLATFAMYGALGGFFFALVIFLQTTAGYSSLAAGATLLPVTIFLLALSSRMGALAGKHGPRLFMTIGPILSGLGILLLAPLGSHAPYLTTVMPGILLFALGLSITVAPLTATVMGSVALGDSGIASAINNAVSRVAGLIVIALLGLFGAAHAYVFAALLCSGLAILAGVISYLMIQNHPLAKSAKAQESAA